MCTNALISYWPLYLALHLPSPLSLTPSLQAFQSLLMAVLIGTVFLRIGTDQRSAVRRQPVLFL